jgi:hypothetical protein
MELDRRGCASAEAKKFPAAKKIMTMKRSLHRMRSSKGAAWCEKGKRAAITLVENRNRVETRSLRRLSHQLGAKYGRPKKSPAPNLAHRSVAIFRQ